MSKLQAQCDKQIELTSELLAEAANWIAPSEHKQLKTGLVHLLHCCQDPDFANLVKQLIDTTQQIAVLEMDEALDAPIVIR